MNLFSANGLTWQEILYPLGLISSIFFTLRVLYQWYLAEITKSSPSPKGFWMLSVGGNSIHLIHSLIQMQLPLAVVQACHLVIAQRNLNLIERKKFHYSLTRVLIHFILAIVVTLLTFFGICYLTGSIVWMRAPTFPILPSISTSPSWGVQTLGLVGIILYASRFWIQWISIERKGRSYFGTTFWVLSLTGAILSSIYFIIILDWVNILSTSFTLIPFARNLLFIRRKPVHE